MERLARVKAFWDEEANGAFPAIFHASSSKPYSFLCPLGHSFVSNFKSLIKTSYACRVCNGLQYEKGINDAATTYPALVSLWSPTNGFALSSISFRNTKMHEWQCEKGHITPKTLQRKISKPGCGVCLHRFVLAGVNDLATTHPELARFVAPRNPKRADELTAGSGDRVWWRCELGHEWQRTVVRMTSENSECPACRGYLVVPGVNTVSVSFPELLELWSPKNKESSSVLERIAFASSRKFWWRCKDGHDTFTTASNRHEFNCGDCKASKGELEVGDFLYQFDPGLIRQTRAIIKPYEVDVFLPKYKIAVEYNGDYWHSSLVKRENTFTSPELYHAEKRRRAQEAGIELIFVWESHWRKYRQETEEELRMLLQTGIAAKRLLQLSSPLDTLSKI